MIIWSTVALTQVSYYSNKVWEHSTAQPNDLPHTAQVIDQDGNIIVVGNTKNPGGDVDVLVVKYDRGGVVLWQETYAGVGGGDDYGVSVVVNGDGDVYVAAAVASGPAAPFDIAILKYSAAGILIWAELWNGQAALNDIPAAIYLYNNDLYVCGATWVDQLTSDYIVLKYDDDGTYQWERRYDHNTRIDVATHIAVNGNGEILVTGAAQFDITEWDYVTIKLHSGSGTIMDTITVSLPGVGLDQVLGMYMAEDGAVYITGYREVQMQKNIQVIKIAPDFTLAWVQNFDSGFDDIGNAIVADAQGNVYVAGSRGDGAGGTIFTTMKFDSSGSIQWVERFQISQALHLSEAKKIALMDDGVVVAGTVGDGTSLNYALIKYDTDGRRLWSKEHDSGFGDDRVLALSIEESGEIYVSGLTPTATGLEYTTVKYDVYVDDATPVLDSLGIPSYMDEQVIIRFFSWVVDTTFVDDREQQHIPLSKLVPDTVAHAIMEKLGLQPTDADHTRLLKIHKRFTRADSISIARSGEQVRLPKFWNSFVMTVDKEVLGACDSLRTLSNIVKFVHPSNMFRPYSEDPIYEDGLQSSLSDGNYINAHINIEPAWGIQSGGPHVRVGIIDTPVKWDHPDFIFDNASRVVAAREYWAGGDGNFETWDIYPFNGFGYHGTACASIIGAVRNNDEGVAGIAGGNAALGMPGVELVSLIVGVGQYQPMHIVSAAMMDAVLYTSQGNGLGCDVVNMSIGSMAAFFPPNYPDLMVEALETGFMNQCTFVGAHGNHYVGEPNFASWPTALPFYNIVHDLAILSVGATGHDQYLSGSGFSGTWLRPPFGPPQAFSNYGFGIDLVAPGSQRMIPVIADGGATYSCSFESFEYPGGYTCMGGTSAAAPHVAGVAALMRSHHHPTNGAANGLSPEDVEILLENSATNLPDDPFLPNTISDYDPYHGHGRVNAGLALEWVSDPYCVLHFQNLSPGIAVSATETSMIEIPENNPLELTPGLYSAYLGTVTQLFQHEFEPGTEIQGSWLRPSLLRGTHPNLYADGKAWGHLDYVINGNMVDVTITTHAWKLLDPDIFYPIDPTAVVTPYSIHVKNEPCWGPSTVSVQEQPAPEINIYPNPANDLLFVDLKGQKSVDGNIKIFDLLGSLVYEQRLPAGLTRVQLPIEMLSRGAYILLLDQGANRKALQFIKL